MFQNPIQIKTNPSNLSAPLKKDMPVTKPTKEKDSWEEDDHSSDDSGW